MRRAPTVLLATLLLAGCGSKSSTNGSRLTAAEYASKADAICTEYKAQTDDLARPASLPDLAKIADQVVPILRHAQSDLSELRPPANEQATADAWVKQFDVLVDDVKKIRDKAKDNDQAGVQALAEPALRDNQHANELATRLGMQVCSKD